MSNNGQGNGQGNGQPGPPSDVPGRGPPERVREKFRRTKWDADGNITVGDEPVAELAQRVDWDNLSPFGEWVMAVLADNGLVDG